MTDPMNDPNKWALLIGINHYPKLDQSYQLHGCENDVELLASILENYFGFPANNITRLRNEQATRAGILAALDALVDRVKPNDSVVIHYSGLGSRIYGREGDAPDGLDQTIVPFDSSRGPAPNRDITDDDLYLRFRPLAERTGNTTIIFDTSHSGLSTRDAFGDRGRQIPPDTRTVEELSSLPDPLIEKIKDPSLTFGSSRWLPLESGYLLIAACRDEEICYEYTTGEGNNSATYGALTYFLGKELQRSPQGTTYQDLFPRVCAQVTAAYPRQHPTMEGKADRLLFGFQNAAVIYSVLVLARVEAIVTLNAGAAHGVTIGSRWAIHSLASTDKDTTLGLVEITKVGTVTSEAQILAEAAGQTITIGDSAVEKAHSYGEMRMIVQIQADPGFSYETTHLANLIKSSNLLRQAAPDEMADVRVYLIAPRADVTESAPIPQLGVLSQLTWAVVALDGQLLMPARSATEKAAPYDLLDNLERIARFRMVLNLKNANIESPLYGKVEFTLLTSTTDGSLAPVEPDEKSGLATLTEGDQVVLGIRNHSTMPIYVGVFDFPPDYLISLIYPFEGGSEQLEPEQSVTVSLEVYLPTDFPMLPNSTPQAPVYLETVKLFATTIETDFQFLVRQEGARGIITRGGRSSSLLQLLDTALTGVGSRSLDILPSVIEDWTTVEQTVILRRRPLAMR